MRNCCGRPRSRDVLFSERKTARTLPRSTENHVHQLLELQFKKLQVADRTIWQSVKSREAFTASSEAPQNMIAGLKSPPVESPGQESDNDSLPGQGYTQHGQPRIE